MIDERIQNKLHEIINLIKVIKRRDNNYGISADEKEQVKKIFGEYQRIQKEISKGESDYSTLAILDVMIEDAYSLAYPGKSYKKPKETEKKPLFNYSVFLYAALACVILIQFFVVGFSPVSGSSMYPTFKDGDLVLIQRKLLVREVERGDVVIVMQGGSLLIKRVIGLPGETVTIKEDNRIYINGVAINDAFGKADNGRMYTERDVVLGDDEYFIMGDNREHSSDSRTFGPVSKSQILGKVIH